MPGRSGVHDASGAAGGGGGGAAGCVGFCQPIKAREGVAGRDATDPKLLVALWLYACIRGIGSGRELARQCQENVAFQWLCGGVSVNHRLLSDFRTDHGKALDQLFTQVIASLVDQGGGEGEPDQPGRNAGAGGGGGEQFSAGRALAETAGRGGATRGGIASAVGLAGLSARAGDGEAGGGTEAGGARRSRNGCSRRLRSCRN